MWMSHRGSSWHDPGFASILHQMDKKSIQYWCESSKIRQKKYYECESECVKNEDFICLEQHNEWKCIRCNLLQRLQTQRLVNKNENRMKTCQQAQINGSNVGGTSAQKRCVKSPASKCWKLCIVCSGVTCKSIFDLLLPSILFYPQDTGRWLKNVI